LLSGRQGYRELSRVRINSLAVAISWRVCERGKDRKLQKCMSLVINDILHYNLQGGLSMRNSEKGLVGFHSGTNAKGTETYLPHASSYRLAQLHALLRNNHDPTQEHGTLRRFIIVKRAYTSDKKYRA
jgi:hypothetical protein